MTRLLIAYDRSDAAQTAIRVAHALFGSVDAVVANVQPPPPPASAGALARTALPDDVIARGLAQLRADVEAYASELAEEGAGLACAVGLRAKPVPRFGISPWRELQGVADEKRADVVVCGTAGENAFERVMLGSTASSLLHHARLPLLICPAECDATAGPLLVGFDRSPSAEAALRFTATHLRPRPLLVAHAWRSPVRHSLRGHALRGSGVTMLEDYADAIDDIWEEVAGEYAQDGVVLARELGLDADPYTPESGHSTWRTLLDGATRRGAAAIVVGSRGRGAAASTVLGSVASGLVHAAEQPVLVVPA